MKYLVATFTIETTADLMQASQDLLADGAAEAGFESFEETETGLEAVSYTHLRAHETN